MTQVRVRFAPSPTGYLHIGGARTALFNWLWARKNKGVFVLRVEDTDRARSTPESVQAIFDSMRWLGLDWDEGPEVGGAHGPYFQTQRIATYAEHAEKLIRLGSAYRDYTTKEELAAMRDAHVAQGHARETFRYTSPWRDRTDQLDKPYTVRFKAPRSGATGWVDLVKGRIDVPNDAQQDQVLLREDGVPLYNFGAVVDDVLMGITLVARGDDHIVNTPIQILLYQALGAKLPTFAHTPMILAPNGEKLSKRHAAVSVLEYEEMGYLPDAVLNYLARLGWSHGDDEIFTRDDLIAKFDFDHVGKTAAKYDAKKFAFVQATHLRNAEGRSGMPSLSDLARLSRKFFEKRGAAVPDAARLERAIATVRTRATTIAEIPEMVDFYFAKEVAFDPAARTKFLTKERAPILRKVADVLRDAPSFEEKALEQRVTDSLPALGLQMKDLGQPVRVALTGKTQSPGLFEMMEVLGRDETLARLERAAATAES